MSMISELQGYINIVEDDSHPIDGLIDEDRAHLRREMKATMKKLRQVQNELWEYEQILEGDLSV